jgi:CCR4-NOT transcription complex subunit 3
MSYITTTAEIDRVMKKVDEGVEMFDEIWEKVYTAEQQNQKEKYEMDLKKEIKKLQRLRDQIKTWVGSNEVKDKDALIEARRLIETKMEQFKVCEKETKTKTYSKEGLAREDKLDPAEESKIATAAWIGEYIEKMRGVVEETDFELERLSTGKGKKTNKHRIERLQEHMINHKRHISKLEGIIRLVNNDRLDTDPVDALRDDFDYYLDSYEDEDYHEAYDEDYFYESLGLEELDVVNVDHVTAAVTTNALKASDASSASGSKESANKKSKKAAALSSVIPLTIGRATRSTGKPEKEEEKPTPTKMARATSTSSTNSTGPARTTPVAASPHAAGASMAAILKRESEQQEKEKQRVCDHCRVVFYCYYSDHIFFILHHLC